MARRRDSARRTTWADCSYPEWRVLTFGPLPGPYDCEAKVTALYRDVGDEYDAIERKRVPGTRPWVWWHVRGLPMPDRFGDHEDALRTLGELTPEEEYLLNRRRKKAGTT